MTGAANPTVGLQLMLLVHTISCFNVNHHNPPCAVAASRVRTSCASSIEYGSRLVALQPIQASVLTDNWITYLSERQAENIPKFTLSSVYDMKVFISRTRRDNNSVFFAWTPYTSKGNVVYVIGGKMVDQDLQVYRFSQSPYFDDMLSIDTLDIVDDMRQYLNSTGSIDFTELHKYDNRYMLAWSIRKRDM